MEFRSDIPPGANELRSWPMVVSDVTGAVYMAELVVRGCAATGDDAKGSDREELKGKGPGKEGGCVEDDFMAGFGGSEEGPSKAAVTVDEARPQVKKAKSFRTMERS